jgi:hypothetical protein
MLSSAGDPFSAVLDTLLFCCLLLSLTPCLPSLPLRHSYRAVDTKMVDIWPVLNEIHREMLPVHEEWVGGMKLQPTNIYGIRVNRNGSALALHYDKVSLQRCAVLCCKLHGPLVSA